MPETVAVLGAGNMGTALAQVIASNGHDIRLWSIEHDVLEEIRDKRLNTKYLEGIELHHRISALWDLHEAIEHAAIIILSVPSQVVPAMARDLAPLVKKGQIILNVAKGLHADRRRRLSEVLISELGDAFKSTVGSMGGPAIAIEMARGLPMAVIVRPRR
jgi:glycerol-3-phosphate dehydrogenase (NAD(P)+)